MEIKIDIVADLIEENLNHVHPHNATHENALAWI